MFPDAKVAICIPSFGLWKSEMGASLGRLCAMSAPHVAFGILTHDLSHISLARNELVRAGMMSKGCTHTLFIDSDMVFPGDAMIRLLKADKDIIGVFYKARTPPHSIVGSTMAENICDGEVVEALILGGGMMLIRNTVFEKMPAPWFRERYTPLAASQGNPDGCMGEDGTFCNTARAAGFHLWVDLGLSYEIGHVASQVVMTGRPTEVIEHKIELGAA